MLKRYSIALVNASLLSVGLLCLAVQAQDSATPSEPPSSSVADGFLMPRFSVQYRSGDGRVGGRGEVSGFIPLLQTPGSNVLFLDTNTQIQQGALRMGSISIGHRSQLESAIFTLSQILHQDMRAKQRGVE